MRTDARKFPPGVRLMKSGDVVLLMRTDLSSVLTAMAMSSVFVVSNALRLRFFAQPRA